uniref:Uncharacterized protein n=1 Tax=Leptobrachium leishanense TaxID=445787 RepID=A0A8C5M1B0_9ANUR
MADFAITPEVALADEPVKIHAWGLLPKHLITFRAWLKDEKGHLFHSRAFYKSDKEGKVDLDHAAAIGGDVQGVYPMGLLWTLSPTTPFVKLIKRDTMSPFHIHLELYLGVQVYQPLRDPPVVTRILEIWYVAPGVQRLQVREGRVRGSLFLPPGEGPFRGIIDLYGIHGGLLEYRSSLLASRGFACLALAYFAYDDLPPVLESVDLKYFEEAAHLLLQNPKVSGDGVGIMSLSKGAEIALAMAAYLPQVKATVCINGSTAVLQESMSFGDIHMKGIPFHFERVQVTDIGAVDLSNTILYDKMADHANSILPLEKANGPILFLVSEGDNLFNSLKFANEAKARAERFGKKDVQVLSFPGAGHLLEPPGLSLCAASSVAAFYRPCKWGGEPLAHGKAQDMCWREIQSHVKSFGQSGLSIL